MRSKYGKMLSQADKLRALALALLLDDHGVSREAWNILQPFLEQSGHTDLIAKVRLQITHGEERFRLVQPTPRRPVELIPTFINPAMNPFLAAIIRSEQELARKRKQQKQYFRRRRRKR